MNTTATPRIVGADPNVPGWDWGDRSPDAVRHATYTPDDRDIADLAERQEARLNRREILVGDWVEFADGVTRRVSHVWSDTGPQTSDGGSWYLNVVGNGDFSGGLFGTVPFDTLTDTGELRPARFWFFHHNWAQAHNAVHADVNVRVWRCTEAAPR